MSESEIARLKREIADLKSQLSEVRSQQPFKTDSSGNVYDTNDNLLRDTLGNLYSGGRPIGPVSGFSQEPFHSENEDEYRYPNGMVRERVTRDSDSEITTTYFPNGFKQAEDESRGNGYHCSREFWLNGRLKKTRIEEDGHVSETLYFEDGRVMCNFSD